MLAGVGGTFQGDAGVQIITIIISTAIKGEEITNINKKLTNSLRTKTNRIKGTVHRIIKIKNPSIRVMIRALSLKLSKMEMRQS